MNFTQSISTCFSKYITFKGRASRSELWWFVLFIVIGNAVTGAMDAAIFGQNTMMMGGMEFSYNAGFIGNIFGLVTFLPTWAVEVRRLHDTGRSGWWLLIGLIPLIGWIILLVWMIGKSDEGDNQYGAKPLA